MRNKILIAEDEPVTREVLRTILTRAGYEVILATDGQTAVEMADSERPDLVLTDGLLPRLHGFLACKAIKEMAAPPKVIILTGVYTKLTYKWEVKKQYGADELLTKPINHKELLDCIANHLQSALDVNVFVPTLALECA
jgi:DNA-binding response OmpR family regulator